MVLAKMEGLDVSPRTPSSMYFFRVPSCNQSRRRLSIQGLCPVVGVEVR